MFIDEFEQFLDRYLELPGHNLICGDFNLHVENINDRDSSSFLDIIQMNNMKQLSDKPTQSHGGILDLVISDIYSPLPIENVFVDNNCYLSDHCPVSFDIPCELPKEKAVTKTQVQEVYNLDIDDFRTDIQSSDLCNPSVFMQMSSDSAAELYNTNLKNMFNRHCPTKDKVYRSTHTKSKWFNSNLQTMKRNKRQALRRFEKHPTEANHELFRKVKN